MYKYVFSSRRHLEIAQIGSGAVAAIATSAHQPAAPNPDDAMNT